MSDLESKSLENDERIVLRDARRVDDFARFRLVALLDAPVVSEQMRGRFDACRVRLQRQLKRLRKHQAIDVPSQTSCQAEREEERSMQLDVSWRQINHTASRRTTDTAAFSHL